MREKGMDLASTFPVRSTETTGCSISKTPEILTVVAHQAEIDPRASSLTLRYSGMARLRPTATWTDLGPGARAARCPGFQRTVPFFHAQFLVKMHTIKGKKQQLFRWARCVL
jgi:hypothetical protein